MTITPTNRGSTLASWAPGELCVVAPSASVQDDESPMCARIEVFEAGQLRPYDEEEYEGSGRLRLPGPPPCQVEKAKRIGRTVDTSGATSVRRGQVFATLTLDV